MSEHGENVSKEVDWTSDEAAVRAMYPEACAVEMEDGSWRIYPSSITFRGPLNIGGESAQDAWLSSRRHPNVVVNERAHNPAYASPTQAPEVVTERQTEPAPVQKAAIVLTPSKEPR